MSNVLELEERDGAVRLRVRVQPRASRAEIAGVHDGALRVRLTSPPVEGAANRQLIDLLSDVLDVPRSAIRLVRGESARDKVVEIEGLRAADVRRVLTQ